MGPAPRCESRTARLDELLANFTVTCWVNVERFPAKGGVYLISKGGNSGWQLGLGDAQQVYFHGSWGGGWYQSPWQGKVPKGTWVHLALTFQKGGQWRTIPADLILLGSPKDNLLIMDEARGGLLPGISKPGEGSPVVTYSPFVGEYQVLNLLATDEAGLRHAVSQTTTP